MYISKTMIFIWRGCYYQLVQLAQCLFARDVSWYTVKQQPLHFVSDDKVDDWRCR